MESKRESLLARLERVVVALVVEEKCHVLCIYLCICIPLCHTYCGSCSVTQCLLTL
jgi:hypothetical protein